MNKSHSNQKNTTKDKQNATWIWYPGDFEIWLGNRFNNRRTERGAMFPPFWKQDSHWVTIEFSKIVNLEEEETIEIATEGEYNFMLDGQLQFGKPTTFTIPEGEHRINIKVHHLSSPPNRSFRSRAMAPCKIFSFSLLREPVSRNFLKEFPTTVRNS